MKEIFINNKLENLIIKKSLDMNNFIDIFDNPMYSKLNFEGFSVYPSEAYILQSYKNLYMLDFVSSMYFDFRKEILLLLPQKKFSKMNSFYSNILDIDRTVSWNSLNTKYINNLNQLFNRIDRRKINSLNDLSNAYESIREDKLFFTRTALNLNNRSDYTYNGLCIEFKGLKQFFELKNTVNKIRYYIDINFNNLLYILKKTGFKFDYNYPYRIFVDLSNEIIYKKYLKSYNVKSVKQLFDVMYYRTFEVDLNSIRQLINTFFTIDNNMNNIELLIRVLSIELNIDLSKEIKQILKYSNAVNDNDKVLKYIRSILTVGRGILI